MNTYITYILCNINDRTWQSKFLFHIIKISSQLTGIISSIKHIQYVHAIICFIFAVMLL